MLLADQYLTLRFSWKWNKNFFFAVWFHNWVFVPWICHARISCYLWSSPFPHSEPSCEWKMVFKAVQGSQRSVHEDWFAVGGINDDIEPAQGLLSDLTYRNGEILDDWNFEQIKRVSRSALLNFCYICYLLLKRIRTVYRISTSIINCQIKVAYVKKKIP